MSEGSSSKKFKTGDTKDSSGKRIKGRGKSTTNVEKEDTSEQGLNVGQRSAEEVSTERS